MDPARAIESDGQLLPRPCTYTFPKGISDAYSHHGDPCPLRMSQIALGQDFSQWASLRKTDLFYVSAQRILDLNDGRCILTEMGE
jgi:hypothetical protein